MEQSSPKNTFIYRNGLFISSAFVACLIAAWGIIAPETMTNSLQSIAAAFFNLFGWWYIWIPFMFLIICLILSCSSIGNQKLGNPDDKPEFSLFSWLAMLFTAGIGVGLVFFGVAEPLIHYQVAPYGINNGGEVIQAARMGMLQSMFHWGFSAWSVYALSGLVVAYFCFRHKGRFLPGEPIRMGFKNKKWAKPVAFATDSLAPIVATLTMSGSIGMGIFQMVHGYEVITGKTFSGFLVPMIMLIIIFVTYAVPACTPLKKGMKWLGDINVVIALLLFLFIFSVGPTKFFMENFITTLGEMLRHLVTMNFDVYLYQDTAREWFNEWPLTYWAWWISWTPFMGVFIARISRGRTIRQYTLAAILIPTAFMLLWFSTFGGFGIYESIYGEGTIAAQVLQDWSRAFFTLLEAFPLLMITGPIAMVLILVFLATGCCSASISLAMMTSHGAKNAPPSRALFWSIIMACIGGALAYVGTMDGVKAAVSVAAIPYSFLLIMQVAAFLRAIRNDALNKKEVK